MINWYLSSLHNAISVWERLSKVLLKNSYVSLEMCYYVKLTYITDIQDNIYTNLATIISTLLLKCLCHPPSLFLTCLTGLNSHLKPVLKSRSISKLPDNFKKLYGFLMTERKETFAQNGLKNTREEKNVYICNFLCHSKNDILVVIRIPVYGTNKQTVNQEMHKLIFSSKHIFTKDIRYRIQKRNNQQPGTSNR